jgi:hypothetical protein
MLPISPSKRQIFSDVHTIAPLARAIYKIEILSKGCFYGFFAGLFAGACYEITTSNFDHQDEFTHLVLSILKTSPLSGLTGSFLGTAASYLVFTIQG